MDYFAIAQLTAIIGVLVYLVVAVSRIPREPTPAEPTYDDGWIRTELVQLADRMDETRVAVAQGIEHVERVEARIRATVKRAQKEFEDGEGTPGLAAEAAALFEHDGDRGAPSIVPDVQPDMADRQPSSIPGISRGALRALGK